MPVPGALQQLLYRLYDLHFCGSILFLLLFQPHTRGKKSSRSEASLSACIWPYRHILSDRNLHLFRHYSSRLLFSDVRQNHVLGPQLWTFSKIRLLGFTFQNVFWILRHRATGGASLPLYRNAGVHTAPAVFHRPPHPSSRKGGIRLPRTLYDRRIQRQYAGSDLARISAAELAELSPELSSVLFVPRDGL